MNGRYSIKILYYVWTSTYVWPITLNVYWKAKHWNKIIGEIGQDWTYLYCHFLTISMPVWVLKKILNKSTQIIKSNARLYTWKIKQSNTCQYGNEIDTLEHHLFWCKHTKIFWRELNMFKKQPRHKYWVQCMWNSFRNRDRKKDRFNIIKA